MPWSHAESKKAREEGRLETRLKHYTKYQLLIIDEIGYLPLQEGDANLLFQIIDRRYEQKSTIVTTNINFDEWTSILQDERVASAIVDRLTSSMLMSLTYLETLTDLRHHIQWWSNCTFLYRQKLYIFILTFTITKIYFAVCNAKQ